MPERGRPAGLGAAAAQRLAEALGTEGGAEVGAELLATARALRLALADLRARGRTHVPLSVEVPEGAAAVPTADRDVAQPGVAEGVSTDSTSKDPAGTGSTRIGSSRIGSTRTGSIAAGATPVGATGAAPPPTGPNTSLPAEAAAAEARANRAAAGQRAAAGAAVEIRTSANDALEAAESAERSEDVGRYADRSMSDRAPDEAATSRPETPPAEPRERPPEPSAADATHPSGSTPPRRTPHSPAGEPEPLSEKTIPAARRAAHERTALADAGAQAPALPSELASRARDLAELRTAVAGCEACGLCRTRTQTVFQDGEGRRPVLFVGEAPGYHEDVQGVPFVGPAGQLLTAIIEQGMGIPRADVSIANVLKCRPPGNRDPLPEEKRLCTPWLDRQIELLDPRVIIPLGRHAACHVLGVDESMGRLRGRVHEHHGRHVVPTYHPSYLLREPRMKPLAWQDIQLAMRLLGLERPPRGGRRPG